MKTLLIIDVIWTLIDLFSTHYCKSTNTTERLVIQMQNRVFNRFFIAGLIRIATVILFTTTIIVLILKL